MRRSVVRPKLVSNGCSSGMRISRKTTLSIFTKKSSPKTQSQ
jgi:hypothetical protein